METDMRKKLRKLIVEMMADHKEHTIFELKDYVYQKTGYVFKKDYTESQMSGAINFLYRSGCILRQERGTYILAGSPELDANDMDMPLPSGPDENDEKSVSSPDSCIIVPENTPSLSIKGLFGELQHRLQEDYTFILQAMKNMDLSDSENEDAQILLKLLQLRDAMQGVMEQRISE